MNGQKSKRLNKRLAVFKVANESIEIQLARILNEYSEEVKEVMFEVAEEVANEGAKELQETSPKNRGKYHKGWGVEKETDGKGTAFIIRNKKYYNLTHLLEKGHALKNGGRARAFPHIAPVEQKAIKSYEDKLARRLGQ